MSLNLVAAPDLTDDQVETLSAEELEIWRQACVRANRRATCEALWPERRPCFKCGALATWYYQPSNSQPESDWACDTCVPRGCSCMATEAYEEAAEAAEQRGESLRYDPEQHATRLADGRISPCMEWEPFTDPAALPAVEDLAGWAAREAAGRVP
jgi:hypothetical protein